MDKKEDVWEFVKLEQQLHSFLAEISELSKKRPNDPLNKFKLKFINATLSKLNSLLKDDRPFADFKQFDIDDLPSNSDVVVILSQYTAAVHRFRLDNTTNDGDESNWIVRGRENRHRCRKPRGFQVPAEVMWRGRPRPRRGVSHNPRGDSRPRLSSRAQLGTI